MEDTKRLTLISLWNTKLSFTKDDVRKTKVKNKARKTRKRKAI